jgi:uncharacterized protein involved in outer membrane biogenesis
MIRVLKWAGIVIGTLVLLLIVGLVILQLDADAVRAPLSRIASAKLHRPVHLDGHLELHLLSLKPHALVRGLRVGNPSWAGGGDMLSVQETQVWVSLPPLLTAKVVVPYADMRNIDLNLVRNASGQANWRFETPNAPHPKPNSKPPTLPLLRALHIGPGRLTINDAIRKLKFNGTINVNAQAQGGAAALRLGGDGTINGVGFRVIGTGQPLITAESHKRYTFDIDVTAGTTHANAQVTVMRPFDLGYLDVVASASGDDFGNLYYLTGLALPNSAPYSVRATVERQENLLKLTRLEGKLGNSDLQGTGSVDMSGTRPVVKADLNTHLLDMKDLGPTLGAGPARKPAPGSLSSHPEKRPGPKPHSQPPTPAQKAAGATLLPRTPLDLERVRGMDAYVTYHAESIKEKKLAIRRIDLTIKLERGVLTLDPVSFELPEGNVATSVRIDASRDIPDVGLDVRLTSVKLSEFHAGKGPPPMEGTLVGRILLHARGNSVHAAAKTADGTVTFVVPHGEIREAFAELAGIDVAKGLGLILSGNQQETPLQCGVANFKAQDGIFAAQNIVFNTGPVLITGKGELDLGDEIVDLSLQGQPKKPRLLRIRTPVLISGTLRKPHVGVETGKLLGQAGVAAALGTILTPIASVLAFVDPGLAKNADCAALIAQSRSEGAPLRQAQTGRQNEPDRR